MGDYATQVQRDSNGSWYGLDGDLHPDDQATLQALIGPATSQALLHETSIQLDKLMNQPISRPQTLGDIVEAKDRLKLIRELSTFQQSLEGK